METSSALSVSLLLLEEYCLLEKQKILAGHGGSVFEDVDTAPAVSIFEPEHRRLLLLEEYFLLEKTKLLMSLPNSRRWWVRPILQNRKSESEFYTAMPLLISGDKEYFKKYFKMTPEKFEELHALVEEPLTKDHTIREPLPSRMRLAITLRYLCSGMHMQDVAMGFRVGISTVSEVVHYTCRLLWRVLQPICLKLCCMAVLTQGCACHAVLCCLIQYGNLHALTVDVVE
ncbi:uncharacterized protein LOC144119877 [Amblyomma americanum]